LLRRIKRGPPRMRLPWEKGGVKTMNSIMDLPVYVFLGES
jgi:hypothetical protein